MMYHGEPDPNGKSKRIFPSWIYRRNGHYIVEMTADSSHPGFKVKTPEAPGTSAITKIDLGSGGIPAPGFTGIDAFVDHPEVLKGDISDLGWFRAEHGLVEAIRSSHSLEHLSHRDAPRVLRDWVNTLQPGGTIEIRVPDLEYHTRKLVEAIDKGEDAYPESNYWIATIYGWQIGGGQVHLNGFTENRLRQLAATSGVVDIEITKNINPGSPSGEIAENGELVLTGRRPGGE
jgi:predicted SAM-dependent methyltransferase